MIYSQKPENFSPRFEVVACFVEVEDKFLLLYRAEEKFQGMTWALPAGKIEPGETKEEAIVRELREETGILVQENEVEYLGVLAVNHGKDFLYHSFRLPLQETPAVKVNTVEHSAFQWYTLLECRALPNLMLDLDTCLDRYYPQ